MKILVETLEERAAVLAANYRNRTDELRLAGNGVVPACCELAVRMGLGELFLETHRA